MNSKASWLFALALARGLSSSVAANKLPGLLFAGLNDFQCPVMTTSANAQRSFSQGMLLLFSSHYKEAIR